MASAGIFTHVNKAIAHGFWYGIAGAAGLLLLKRILSAAESRRRLSLQKTKPNSVPSRPHGVLSQAYATATATVREMAYPQPWYFTGRISKYFSPLPLGRWLILAVYWVVILMFLWANTILKPNDAMYAYKWEKVGFRAAWVSVTQIPFIYLLACKFNPFSLVSGVSYERLNWIHRWAARTVFFTAIVHWSFFLREWWLADFVQLEIQMMPMVKYGFGAFGVVTWMVLSGFGFFRAMNYELFVAQHICAAAVLLWLLFKHVPSYAQYNIWMSIGFLAFDWGMRIIWGVLRNVHLLGAKRLRKPGYDIKLEPLPGDMVRLTIDEVDFSWKAGQHAYLSVPRLRPLEMHPFTIANASQQGQGPGSRPLSMLIKAHSGFSKSLHKAAVKSAMSGRSYRAILSGPWGMPPDLLHYDTVVLIAASSGASYTTPLLEELVRKRGCLRKITLHWIIRTEEYFDWFGETLTSLIEATQDSKLSLEIIVHVTQPNRCDSADVAASILVENDKGNAPIVAVDSKSGYGSSGSSLSDNEKSPLSPAHHHGQPRQVSSLRLERGSRPSVETMVRPSVEAALGETAVVVCGGLSITAQTRTFVAALSDERAVHKGTGAQGIFLWTETYGW